MYQPLGFKCSGPQAFPYPCWADCWLGFLTASLISACYCVSLSWGHKVALLPFGMCGGMRRLLSTSVPLCIRSPLALQSLKLQFSGSAQHLSHMRSSAHLEYQMFFPVWGSLLLIIRHSLHIRKILYFCFFFDQILSFVSVSPFFSILFTIF